MNETGPWHERDDFWEAYAPFMFSEGSWSAAPAEVDGILNLLQAEPGSVVLDLGCGPGRHSLELARRGYSVTGVDRTATHVEKARAAAQREGLSVELVQADMRDFSRTGSFDYALLMFTSFGYFEDQTENRQVLANVYRSLKKRGALIVDVAGKEVIARVFQARDWHEEQGTFLLQERVVAKNWSWMESLWILLKGRDRFQIKISHWLYSAAELTALLNDVGFQTVEVFGNLEGAAYDTEAKRLVTVARK